MSGTLEGRPPLGSTRQPLNSSRPLSEEVRPGSDHSQPHQDLRLPSSRSSSLLHSSAQSISSSSFHALASLHATEQDERQQSRPSVPSQQSASSSSSGGAPQTLSLANQMASLHRAAEVACFEWWKSCDGRIKERMEYFASIGHPIDDELQQDSQSSVMEPRSTGIGMIDISDDDLEDDVGTGAESEASSNDTEEEVVARTMLSTRRRRHEHDGQETARTNSSRHAERERRSAERRRRSSLGDAYNAFAKELRRTLEDFKTWCKMTEDLATGAGVPSTSRRRLALFPSVADVHRDSSSPVASSMRDRYQGGIAASMLALTASVSSSQTSTTTRRGTHPFRVLPHPIWARRYPGPAGEWLRAELARRACANSASVAAAAAAAQRNISRDAGPSHLDTFSEMEISQRNIRNGRQGESSILPTALANNGEGQRSDSQARILLRLFAGRPGFEDDERQAGAEASEPLLSHNHSTSETASENPNDEREGDRLQLEDERSLPSRAQRRSATSMLRVPSNSTALAPTPPIATPPARSEENESSNMLAQSPTISTDTQQEPQHIPIYAPSAQWSNSSATIHERLRSGSVLPFHNAAEEQRSFPSEDTSASGPSQASTSVPRIQLPEESTSERSSSMQHQEETRQAAANSIARMAQASRERAAAARAAAARGESIADRETNRSERSTRGGLDYIRHLRELDGLESQSRLRQIQDRQDADQHPEELGRRPLPHEVFPWYTPPRLQVPSLQPSAEHVHTPTSVRPDGIDPDGDSLDWYTAARARMDAQATLATSEQINEDPDGDHIDDLEAHCADCREREGRFWNPPARMRRREVMRRNTDARAQRQRNRAAHVMADGSRETSTTPTDGGVDAWTLLEQRPSSPVRETRDEGSENVTTWFRSPAQPSRLMSTSPAPIGRTSPLPVPWPLSTSAITNEGSTARSQVNRRMSGDPRTTRRPRRLPSLNDDDVENVRRHSSTSAWPTERPREEVASPIQSRPSGDGRNWWDVEANRTLVLDILNLDLDDARQSQREETPSPESDTVSEETAQDDLEQENAPSSSTLRQLRETALRSRRLTDIAARLEGEFRARQVEWRGQEERLRAEVALRRFELDELRRREGRIGRVLEGRPAGRRG